MILEEINIKNIRTSRETGKIKNKYGPLFINHFEINLEMPFSLIDSLNGVSKSVSELKKNKIR